MTSQFSPTDNTHFLTVVHHNASIPEGCVELRLNDLDFMPWNNSDNIVSAEVEKRTRKARILLLTILFFNGGLGNVINMAVFFKQGLRDRVNLLLFSLSLADCVFVSGNLAVYGEELVLSLGGENMAGPILQFVLNNNLISLMNFDYVSFFLSTIISCERCYCVLRPLKYQTLMKHRTTAFIVVTVYAVFIALRGLVNSKYYLICAFDPVSGSRFYTGAPREFYLNHQDLIDYLDVAFFGIGSPVVVLVVVTSTTIATASKLRQIVTWRTETSSSLSAKEVALTKMLIGTSVLLIVCLTPSIVFRMARLFMPEMNTQRRNQNFFLTLLWISQMFTFINSSFNIFVYYTMGTRYRQTLWKLFGRNVD